jgi:hypothetical protein
VDSINVVVVVVFFFFFFSYLIFVRRILTKEFHFDAMLPPIIGRIFLLLL